MATSAIRMLLAARHHVTLLCKANSARLLRDSYPEVEYVTFNWPWTAFQGKYRLWKWPWISIFKLIWRLRHLQVDAALSIRPDPRDHLLMVLSGAGKRVGFGTRGTAWWLTDSLKRIHNTHRVHAWHETVHRLSPEIVAMPPHLAAYSGRTTKALSACPKERDLIVVHCGAGQLVRRWPLAAWADVIKRIRHCWQNAYVAVVADPDGYGSTLEAVSDHVVTDADLESLAALLASAKVVMANDSGPGHMAAALGVPVCTIFGPQVPDVFRPYGDLNCVVEGLPCKYRPCFDNCHFNYPYCLQDLTADAAWQVILPWLEKRRDGSSL